MPAGAASGSSSSVAGRLFAALASTALSGHDEGDDGFEPFRGMQAGDSEQDPEGHERYAVADRLEHRVSRALRLLGRMCAVSQIERPGRRPPQTFGAMTGALVFLVLVVLGWALFRALTSDHKSTPVRTVDWAAWVKAGRAEQALALYAPPELPAGWRATSVDYVGGNQPQWHLGMLTDRGKYVGIEESRLTTRKLVEQYIDPNAVRGKDVEVDGTTWQTWSDSGGDHALVRSVQVDGRPYESVLVGGSADQATVERFVGSLEAGPVKPMR